MTRINNLYKSSKLKSRDTTLKVWKFSEADELCELTQTLSGHRDSVTFVRFLPSSTFQEALSRLDQSNNDDELLFDQLSKWRTRLVGDDNDDEISSSDKSLPLVISSSLDNSFRLWSIAPISFCLKEFYLYNPVNHFDLRGTQLVFAMGDLITYILIIRLKLVNNCILLRCWENYALE
jgi:WD40 repeat protein